MRDVKRLAAARGARNVRCISSPRGLVFLVDMDEGRSLFDLVALTDDVRQVLGIEVDVLTAGSLSPYLRRAILAEAMAL